ncbi:unnamed protein product [Lymnaea stagnalis]|uniref:C-type lectin domain-containing protein n=1 Tax=Lymnaea stagnalis TaxID=6523 RepID=A0AAV2I998_LYMST
MTMTTVGCVYFGILTFLFCFHQALLSSVVLNAQPATLDLLTTEHLTVNCSYAHSNTSRVQVLISLFLSWSNDSTRPFQDVASINVFSHGHPVNVLTPGDVLASGEINIEGQSYVQLRWVLPNGGQVGFYKCSAEGTDNVGHNVIESDVIEVKGKTLDMNQLLLAIRNITFRQKETEETLEELKRNIASLTSLSCNNTEVQSVIFPSIQHWLNTNALSYLYSNQDVYYLSRLQFLSVAKAQEFCEIIGGYLIEIDDITEYTSILPMLSGIGNHSAIVYTGGTEEQGENHWVFRTSGRPVTFFIWTYGKDFTSSDYNCLALYQEHGWEMSETFCSNQHYTYYALCERAI